MHIQVVMKQTLTAVKQLHALRIYSYIFADMIRMGALQTKVYFSIWREEVVKRPLLLSFITIYSLHNKVQCGNAQCLDPTPWGDGVTIDGAPWDGGF